MMQIGGVARVPDVQLVADLTFPGLLATPARVERVEKFAGASVGSAVVSWPIPPAQNALVGFGKRASIKVGGEYIFRGTVGTSPVYVSAERDMVEAVLYDDKWGMQRFVLGQSGIGSLSGAEKGFPDVGFDIIFNRDGRPNKKSGELNFSTGTSAQYWTLSQALQFVFSFYIDPAVATLNTSVLDSAFGRSPSHLVLTGQNGLQAVDAICQLAGRSWGLKAGASASSFVLVKPGGTTTRTVHFFSPLANRVVTDAGDWHAAVATVQGSILHARDRHQGRSGAKVIETTITSEGTDALLTKVTYKDKQFAARFECNRVKYSANGLGGNLAADARPKPWLSALVTRLNGSAGYVAAASMATHLDDPRVEIPVWVSIDEGKPYWRAIGGYEVDYQNALIDFEANIEFVMPRRVAGGSTVTWEKVALPVDWTKATVRATVAVVIEERVFIESASEDSYLPDPFYVVIDKPDLVPEYRYKSKLPKLTTSPPNDVEEFAAEAVETYVDITDRLQEAVDASLESMPCVETPITVEFPLFPLAEIGDALEIEGRKLGATGDEVIIAIRYGVHGSYRTDVEATNVTAAIDPERFVRR